MIEYIY